MTRRPGVIREPVTEPSGPVDIWIEDPDGSRIVLVEDSAASLPAVVRDRRHRQDDEAMR